ncbi:MULTISPECIES: lytic transglycosylase domain-containing protein [Alphaproteobacteria]|jgi:soluble lytic murein transglycosylase-like protein|uniref:Lytic transglycosylase domain-containing protein n=1 Tax=Sphingobium yanoikuyae TaxID=13690 RepID=A0A430BGA5_SPHYA|nr:MULTISPECIES: lytic transglycosylase domain-containing protein [Alphaproteobacteria]MCW5705793.1 lytic transglycosylase domain-containing protein [Shinella sp.]RSU48676.1 lytic transglycosylase domain-containing protein [Sphingobium yanoikuyae]
MPAARIKPVVGGRIALRRAALFLLSGLILAAPAASTAYAQQAQVERPSRSDPYGTYIAEAAQRFGIPEAWIRAVMRVESAGDVRAISSAGAMGLMQIMPATWAELRVRHRLGGNPYDPRDNILAGAAYLREMHDRYGSPGFLAAYNAGPGRYEEYLAGRPLPAETRAYVATLASIVGGGELTGPVTVAAADPLAWTRAPLFVVQSAGSGPAVPLQSEGESDATTTAAPERDQGPVASRPDGLFVARSVSGGPR